MTRARISLLALAALSVAGAPLVAQEVSLERVEQLTRLGRTDEARSVLLAWWDDGRSEASRRDQQRGFWLRGRLSLA